MNLHRAQRYSLFCPRAMVLRLPDHPGTTGEAEHWAGSQWQKVWTHGLGAAWRSRGPRPVTQLVEVKAGSLLGWRPVEVPLHTLPWELSQPWLFKATMANSFPQMAPQQLLHFLQNLTSSAMVVWIMTWTCVCICSCTFVCFSNKKCSIVHYLSKQTCSLNIFETKAWMLTDFLVLEKIFIAKKLSCFTLFLFLNSLNHTVFARRSP